MQFDLMSFKASPVDVCSGGVGHRKHTKNVGCFTKKVRIPPALKPVKTRSSSLVSAAIWTIIITFIIQ